MWTKELPSLRSAAVFTEINKNLENLRSCHRWSFSHWGLPLKVI